MLEYLFSSSDNLKHTFLSMICLSMTVVQNSTHANEAEGTFFLIKLIANVSYDIWSIFWDTVLFFLGV